MQYIFVKCGEKESPSKLYSADNDDTVLMVMMTMTIQGIHITTIMTIMWIKSMVVVVSMMMRCSWCNDDDGHNDM